MRTEAPKLDTRSAAEIYEQALQAAKVYLPQWIKDPDSSEPLPPDYFNPRDTGLVLLKLLSRMSESILAQLNRVPDKHKLAFYDLLGVELLPPRAAKAPLTFYLGKGASGGYVKKGTQVASKENDKVIFETLEDLAVFPVSIDKALSFDPWRDRYTIHENISQRPEEKNGQVHSLFGYDQNEKKCGHRLHFRNDLLFNVEEKSALKVTIQFPAGVIASDKGALFRKWYHEDKEILPEDITQTAVENILTCEIQLNACEESEKETGYWVGVSPREDLEMYYWRDQIPQIEKVGFSYSCVPVSPSLLFAENIPLEAQKGFYPFGKMPEAKMCFYIGSQSVFGKAGAQVTIDVVCDTITPAGSVSLEWEYWNGKTWNALMVTDHTNSFANPGAIVFEAPGIPPGVVNSKESRWIRARMPSNIYGRPASYEVVPGSNPPEHRLQPATFQPPYVSSIYLTYSYENRAPQEVFGEDYFEKKTLGDLLLSGPVRPYIVKNEENPAFFIAFNDFFVLKPLSFLFLPEKRLFNEHWLTLEKPGVDSYMQRRGLPEWQYFNGKSWVKMDSVKDDTSRLSEQGIVNFQIPDDIAPVEVFGEKRCWLRYTAPVADVLSSVRLCGIHPNTVMAANAVAVRGETLGSSNGKPGQVFQVSRTPVLEDECVEVIEPEAPTDDERGELKNKDFDVTEVIGQSGVTEAWRVRWQKVGEFTLSGPKSRHYMIHRQSGEIIFGNGKNGLIPPKGRNNVVISYRAGGGTSGNVDAGLIAGLKTAIPNIESAVNMSASSGGASREVFDGLIRRAPHTMKTKDRAVTAEDYEWLAKEADQGVYRSRCIRDTDGKVKLMVLPDSNDRTPTPTAQMLKNIREYLTERSTFTVAGEIEVLGPVFKIIDVVVTFKPVELSRGVALTEKLTAEICAFFHSVTGNVDGEGWNFGEDIYTSDLSARLENQQGVDYIKDITLSYLLPGDPGHVRVSGIGNIKIGDHEIAGYGKVTVKAEA